VERQVQPYSAWTVNSSPDSFNVRPSYPGKVLGTKEAALAWWEKHKATSLHQIQVEALDWVIAEEAKRPKDYVDKEQKHLAELRTELVKSGKAMAPGNGIVRFLPMKK